MTDMKTIFICSFLFLPGFALTQNTTPKNDYRGFYAEFSLMGVGWSMPDHDEIEPSIGFGAESAIGYNLSPNFAFFIPISISRFNPDQGADYQFYNYGIGGKAILSKPRSRSGLMIQATYNYLMIYSNIATGDIIINGFGPGFGSGLYIAVSENLNLELSYTKYWINATSVFIGPHEFEADGDIENNQFSIGLAAYF